MFTALRDLPIKRKLMTVIVLASSVAVLLMGTVLIVYERVSFRRELASHMDVLAQIVGSNSTAALAFQDSENAREILAALLAERNVRSAAIYDRTGAIFARFPENKPLTEFPTRPGRAGDHFDKQQFFLYQPIAQHGMQLGTIYLQADLSAMYGRFRIYGLLLLWAGLCATLASIGLAVRLQRGISDPILELAGVATAVSEKHDYSVRAIKHGRDEIGQLTDALNEMLTRLGAANAALSASAEELRFANQEKDTFFAVLSHELRTPLTPVLAMVGLLEEDSQVPEELRRDLSMIRRNIELEARLIDDLLDINRIIRGKLDLNRQVMNLRPLVEHAIQNYCGVTARKKNIRVTSEIAATECYAFVDAPRLTQVLWNLLQNAVKFTPDGGEIGIRVFNQSRAVNPSSEMPGETPVLIDLIIQIKDSGIGISPETLPRIFAVFEQGIRSRRGSYGGLGLGLSISRAIMEMHGGSIEAFSEGKDRGATFTVRLHTVRPSVAYPAEQIGDTFSVTANRRRLRVLVVEDHADTAEQFARLLKRAGHEVICAKSIKEAQQYAIVTPGEGDRACAFDVLISDLDLPDGSGRDLMRNLSRAYPIRGIAVSGHGMKEDVDSSLAAGFLRHITKPVTWEKLKHLLQEASDDIAREEARQESSSGKG